MEAPEAAVLLVDGLALRAAVGRGVRLDARQREARHVRAGLRDAVALARAQLRRAAERRLHAVVARGREQLEAAPAGLRHAVVGHEAVDVRVLLRGQAPLLEDVGEGPPGEDVHHAVQVRDGPEGEGRGRGGVVALVADATADVVLLPGPKIAVLGC